MSKPVIIVAGMGRCGLTLTMHMLASVGVSCVGEAPDYEVWPHVVDAPEWLDRQAGRAVKVVGPEHWPLPRTLADIPRITIWLDRDLRNQARSQAKLATAGMGFPMPARSQLRRWEASLVGGRDAAMRSLKNSCAEPTLRLSFEEMIGSPSIAAAKIAGVLFADFGELDTDRMAGVVLPRSADCAPDLSIESALIRQAEAA